MSTLDELFASKQPIAHLYKDKNKTRYANKILVLTDSGYKEVQSFPGLKIQFNGGGNLIKIHESVRITGSLNISLGSDNLVIFNKGCAFKRLNVVFEKANKSSCIFGHNVEATDLKIYAGREDGLETIIGNNTIIARGTTIRMSDGHSILYEGKIINKPVFGVHIGNHVWIAQDVLCLKDSTIPSGCVVGAKACINKSNYLQNSLIVGIPAKVIKQNVEWNWKSYRDLTRHNSSCARK